MERNIPSYQLGEGVYPRLPISIGIIERLLDLVEFDQNIDGESAIEVAGPDEVADILREGEASPDTVPLEEVRCLEDHLTCLYPTTREEVIELDWCLGATGDEHQGKHRHRYISQ